MTPEELRARLLAGDATAGPLRDLVHLGFDQLLDTPVQRLVDADWLAEQLVAALGTASASEDTERWLQDRIRDLRAQVPDERLSAHAPPEVIDPLRAVLLRPVTMDRDLTMRLLDHKAVEKLLAEIVSGALQDFASKLKPLTQVAAPKVPKFGKKNKRLRGLQALGKGVVGFGEEVLGGLSAEVENTAKARVKGFVRDAQRGFLGQVADHLCDPRHAARYGKYRVHVLDTLLDTPLPILATEVDKLDPDHLVETGAAVARALARRDGFQNELAAVIHAAIFQTEGRSLRDFLRESGLEEGWRDESEVQLTKGTRELVESEAFGQWLETLLAE